MKTAFIHNSICEKHETPSGHPENTKRYSAIMDSMKRDSEFWQTLTEVESAPVSKGVILAAHTKDHYKNVETAFARGTEYLDGDTMISMKSFDAAVHAAGGACQAVDLVMKKEVDNAFVAARPPGHHATSENAMGFCLFNNVAVATRYAQNRYKEIERVAIIDWDVHHGNGTQGIFFDDPTVHFFSIHQYPWYPGSGSWGETGFGRGKGYTLNLPVKAKTLAKVQRRMFEDAIGDIRRNFRPDIILISAGFDAHATDPLGQLKLEDGDFISMTNSVKQWANEVCEGRIVSCLEGGYNLKTLGETVKSHVKALSD